MIKIENITDIPVYPVGAQPSSYIQMELEYFGMQLYHLGENAKADSRFLQRLRKFIHKHPNYPSAYNYLFSAYELLEQKSMAINVVDVMMERFPDYLFARVEAAKLDMEAGYFDEIHDLLGETLELEDLYPDRHIFHGAEVTTYYMTVAQYYECISDYEKALSTLTQLEEVLVDFPENRNMIREWIGTLKSKMKFMDGIKSTF
ncbi:M48 family metallopeptidase [Persicobacter sp. CCB-QB2]|uniref:tetratricopeptide repeat protein n=1 Tax=Persicobacter sp. CCB-QB2 TaxID=1561025 RepID=UPI0012FB6F22|nr:hypothetical protein [Persicobacter sp. CCB-QB2]